MKTKKKEFTSFKMWRRYGFKVGAFIVAPYVLGLSVGAAIFGDSKEYENLVIHRSQYLKELTNYKKEIYYS